MSQIRTVCLMLLHDKVTHQRQEVVFILYIYWPLLVALNWCRSTGIEVKCMMLFYRRGNIHLQRDSLPCIPLVKWATQHYCCMPIHTFTIVAIRLQGEPIETSAVVGANGVLALLRAATIVAGTFIHICNY